MIDKFFRWLRSAFVLERLENDLSRSYESVAGFAIVVDKLSDRVSDANAVLDATEQLLLELRVQNSILPAEVDLVEERLSEYRKKWPVSATSGRKSSPRD